MNKPLIVEQFLVRFTVFVLMVLISIRLTLLALVLLWLITLVLVWFVQTISLILSTPFLVHTLMMESFINLGRSMSSCSFLCVPRLASVAAGWIACAVFIEKCFNEWVLQPPFQAVFFLASDCVDARILGT
ncbi:uncharacterized protein LOC129296259 isoform X1 [Prosopis cineraria]|uniref:uncharacterized protein LOC129295950 isoform X1 n=1 Tax=Prosopis cineraria TaxID=364024 RepID=UPI00240F9D6B|nr:uncharacterized protein LOC129295950 isoform X1 [Prosopis cineraria]XP_054790523.1 uncharacterized protein LOC129295951 isoform X1 [Prosopis cineraria]XP_054790822.1 uncharacterized protein LOC129296259 isoform X1 [Prosopis cineraria]